MRLIDADMALELKDKDMNWVYDLTDLDQFLAGVPTAEAELVRHGKWIQIRDADENDNIVAQCNLCGHSDTHSKSIVVPYCWYCGAKMDLNN